MARAPGSFTYDPTTTPQTALGQVRQRLGDVDEDDPLLFDEEINARLAAHSDDVTAAAIDCCYMILSLIARDVDADGAGIRASRAQKTQHYRDLLRELRSQIVPIPEMRGSSKSQIEALEADSDFQGLRFKVGMFDY